MMKRTILLLLAAALASCAGASPPQGASNAFVPAAKLRGASAGLAPEKRATGGAKFTIRIPLRKKPVGGRIVPLYISPSTQSIAISVDGGTPVTTNLTPSSPNCSLGGPISYLICSIVFTADVGPHVFSLITYNGTGGHGSALSANTNVPFTVVSGSNTPLGVTLGGIATSVSVAAAPVPQVRGSQFAGYSLYGNTPVTFTVAPVDAGGNLILGIGAPAVTLKNTSPALAIGTPKPSAPNNWTLKSNFQSVNPTVPQVVAVSVKSTPIPNSNGNIITGAVRYSLFQPWVYVANQATNKVGTTDEQGNAKTPSGSSPWAHVPDSSGIAYDPHNFWPYIPSIDDDLACVYDLEGNLIYVPGGWAGMHAPYDMAYGSTKFGDRLFAANNTFADYGGRAVTVYDEAGTLQTVSGTFSGMLSAVSLAWDSHNGNLYVTDGSLNTVFEFDTEGNPVHGFSGSGLPDTGYGGIAFDSHTNTFYLVDHSNGKVVVFSENGSVITLPSGAFPNLSSPWGIAYDPYNGFLYIGNQGDNMVRVYDENGKQQAPLAGFPSEQVYPGQGNPWGIAVVP